MALALLKELSSGPTPERRLELLRQVTDLYLSHPEDPSETEDALFADILDRVLDTIAPAAKAMLADKLADAPRTPGRVAQKLAWDDNDDVAYPLISRSRSLSQEDILDIASRASDARLKAVAERASVPASVTDILIERGSSDVLKTVARNQGAEISAGGMIRIAARGKDDIEILEGIFKRGDLRPDSVVMIKGMISDELAQRLSDRGIDIEQGLPAAVLKNATSSFREEMKRRRAEVSGVERLLGAVQKREISIDQALGTVLERQRLLDVASLMAPLLGLDRNLVFHTLATGATDNIAIMFRALEADHASYCAAIAAKVKKQRSGAGAEGTSTPLTRADYDRIDPMVAQRSMRFLKARIATA